MQQVNLHQQRMIALVIAGVCFISLLLPWMAPKAIGLSQNGFHSWGILSMFGTFGAAASAFMGNKLTPFEGQAKQVALGSFVIAALGAFFFLIRLLTGSLDTGLGSIKYSDFAKPGIGLFICLLLSVAALAWMYGLIKLPVTQPPASVPPPPPPPPPTI